MPIQKEEDCGEDDEEKVEELAIIELQGDLAVDDVEGGLTNKFLADLHYTKAGVPQFIIGHHVVQGKVITLQKPMVLVRKVRKQYSANLNHHGHYGGNDDDERLNMMDNDISGVEDKKQEISQSQPPSSYDDEVKIKTEYVVKAVIRKKILFNKRPQPLVST